MPLSGLGTLPGPMAAIDEGDKIRTIYDGSWGGANAHIQANCEERTTAHAWNPLATGGTSRTSPEQTSLCALGMAIQDRGMAPPQSRCH